ncbi:MAG: addiction module protein [Chlorobiaceae bacterium]
MPTKDLITEAIAMPPGERALIVDSLLKSPNPAESEIETKWAGVAQLRLKELKSGSTKAPSGEDVLDTIMKRLQQ